ncbi:MAG: YihY/virulence factor BrkB family protein [Prochlorothrix sp.]
MLSPFFLPAFAPPSMFQALRYLNVSTCKQVTCAVMRQRLPGLAAEIAYNATLSLFPTILALLSAMRALDLSRPALRNLAVRFANLAPLEVVDLIRGFVDLERPPGRLFQISFVLALWVSSSAIAASMAALDQIQETPRADRRPFWKSRSIAILLSLGTMIFYVVSSLLIFSSEFLIQELSLYAGRGRTILLGIWWMLNWPIALALVTIAFACLYRFGPSRRNTQMPIFLGAFLAAIAWLGVSYCFRYYLHNFGSYDQAYGTLATAIILMFWLDLCALIMLIGYQLNVTVGSKMARSEQSRSDSPQSSQCHPRPSWRPHWNPMQLRRLRPQTPRSQAPPSGPDRSQESRSIGAEQHREIQP